MKIALVAHDATLKSPPGDDLQAAELGESLAAGGHQVTVYARRRRAGQPARAVLRPGVRIEYLGPAEPDSDPLTSMPSFSEPLRARLASDRPDVVHAVRWNSGLAALAASRGLGIPLVQAFGSLSAAERRYKVAPGGVLTARIRLEPAIGRSAAAVVAANSDDASELARSGVPRRSIRVVPCGVDTGEFAPEGPVASRNGRPRLLAVTDFTERAGLDVLFSALAKVPDAELVIAGGAPRQQLAGDKEYQGLRALADSLGLAGRVVFAGAVDRHKLPALLRSADLLVHVSAYSPAGLVPLRAMACGTPVVASGAGAPGDAVLDGTTGLLVPPGRPALLAQQIRRLLAHPMMLQAYGVAAADRARSRYSWERIAAETVAVYDRARAAA